MHFISTVYSFFSLGRPDALKTRLKDRAAALDVRGLMIVAPEGFNGTFSCADETRLEQFRSELRGLCGDPDVEFKDSRSEKAPFRRFTVKVRDEIVSLGAPELRPREKLNHHLTPTEWNEVLRKENVLLLDLRNDYEYSLGTFSGALNPKTEKFSDFPAFMRAQDVPPDRKILMFCTGGIRCEKGILELERQGYRNVFQLKGGILKYLEEKPGQLFQGECLVFDDRVAVDQNLQPSRKYTWCPHCGNPAATPVRCARCSSPAQVCGGCLEKMGGRPACSKNCRNIMARGARPRKTQSKTK